MPAHRRSFAREWQISAETAKKQTAEHMLKTEERYNLSAKTLRPLKIGTSVLIQNQITGRWDRVV